ncbi:MAG TPA: radical SAM protein [bacterium]|nr:radical SAM protein [bacterium]
MAKISKKMILNFLYNFFLLKFKGKKEKLKPLFFSYYLTLNCNFNCSYCSFAKSGATKKPDNKLNTKDVFKILKIIRKESADIYFTGGEPLIRSDIVEILKECKRLKFKSIFVNTNMSLIHKKMEILDYVTNLVSSLDMLNTEKYAKILGIPKETVNQVRENIITCAKLQKEKNFLMTINCVISPDTLKETRKIMGFCLKNNIGFAVVPAELDYGEIDPLLKDSKEYKQLIEDIIKQKKKINISIFGTKKYLKTILNFEKFNCYPNLIPHVYPNGDILWPCEPLKKFRVNLIKEGSYKKALEKSVANQPLPKCSNKCHKACYIEPSCFLQNPLLLLQEL